MTFTDSIPVTQLHPHQALALINRWVKLKNYWYHDDRNALYELKDELIKQWVSEGTMIATKIIKRESSVIAGMKAEIISGGANLYHLDRLSNWLLDVFYKDPRFKDWQVLAHIVNENEIRVPLEPKKQEKLTAIYQQQQAEYETLLQQYKLDSDAYSKALLEFGQNINQYIPALKDTLNKLLTETSSKKTRGRIKNIINWLNQTNLGYFGLSPKQVHSIKLLLKEQSITLQSFECVIVPKEPKRPTPPKEPELYANTGISVSDYIEGSIPEVEAAIEWARTVLNQPELEISDIDDDIVHTELEDILSDELLEQMQVEALEIFKRVVNGKLSNPQEIYNELTALDLDYSSAIGMESYDKYGITYHKDFCYWHEINLSPTGYWLVEFESKIDPSITLHIPYDRAATLKLVPSELSEVESNQEQFGRVITRTEQKAYPIVELLKILGKDTEDFPYELQKYSKPNYSEEYDNWMD